MYMLPNTAVGCARSRWFRGAQIAAICVALAIGTHAVPALADTTSQSAAGVDAPPSPEEAALNAFGDPWSLARSNPSVPLIGTAGCYRKPAEGMDWDFTQQELDFHRALGTPFVHEGCAVILENDPPVKGEPPDGNAIELKKRIEEFKQALPTQKYIGYFDVARWEGDPIGFGEIRREHKDWFVYPAGASKDDLANRLRANRGHGFLLDVTNPLYQDFIAQEIADGLAYYGMDGLLVDGVYSSPRVDKENEGLVPDEIKAGWADGQIAILSKIKERIGSEKYVFANVGRDEKDAFKKGVLNVVDGLMLEDGFSPVKRPLDPAKGRLAGTLRTYDLAAEADKYVIVTANTFVDGSNFDSTSPARERAFARYYLAAHLIFMKGKVMLLYHPPSASQRQYGAEAFFSDWNINVGSPAGSYEEIADDVYQRAFANAVVYLNSSEEPYPITPVPGFDLAPDGKAVTSLTLEPKSGLILSRPEALQ